MQSSDFNELFNISDAYFDEIYTFNKWDYFNRSKKTNTFAFEVFIIANKNEKCSYCSTEKIKYFIRRFYKAKKKIYNNKKMYLENQEPFKMHMIQRYNAYIRTNCTNKKFYELNLVNIYNIFLHLIQNYEVVNEMSYFNDYICESCFLKLEDCMIPMSIILQIVDYKSKVKFEEQFLKINLLKKQIKNIDKLNHLSKEMPDFLLSNIFEFYIGRSIKYNKELIGFIQDKK